MASNTPKCTIVAGPNGAGKTTFALTYLPKFEHCDNFINADLIASGLSPLAPERELITASRLFLKEIDNQIQKQSNFSFETTLSGRSYLSLINKLQSQGWFVHLLYLSVQSVELSKQRVVERVSHGGHNIPVDVIERRYSRSLKNLLEEYSFIANRTQCFDNGGSEPVIIFEQEGRHRNILNEHLYTRLLEASKT